MGAKPKNTTNRLWGAAGLLAAICGFLIMTGVSAQQSPFQVVRPVDKDVPKTERTYSISVNGELWPKVFEWLTSQTGMPVHYAQGVKVLTLGALSYTGPKDKRYTLGELIDVFNDALMLQKHILIRTETSFVVYPADVPIPRFLVPTILVPDLNKRGRTEVVAIILNVVQGPAEEIAPAIKRQMTSNFGEVFVVPNEEKLVLEDAAGQLKVLLEVNSTSFKERFILRQGR